MMPPRTASGAAKPGKDHKHPKDTKILVFIHAWQAAGKNSIWTKELIRGLDAYATAPAKNIRRMSATAPPAVFCLWKTV